MVNAGAKSRNRGGLIGGGVVPPASGAGTSSLPATLLASDSVRDPKMLLRPRRDPMGLTQLSRDAVKLSGVCVEHSSGGLKAALLLLPISRRRCSFLQTLVSEGKDHKS